MILSIHIPKTAGISFGEMLRAHYGPRVFFDYGDWTGYLAPEAVNHRKARYAEVAAQVGELASRFDVIHGHFNPIKYTRFFPNAGVVAFFRDPYQQSISNYEFLRRNPHLPHPAVRIFHERGMSIYEYLEWQEVADPQSNFLGEFPLESLAMAGIAEQFDRSVLLFNKLFGSSLTEGRRANMHPDLQGRWHDVSPAIQRAVERHRQADLSLYRRATSLFEAQARAAGV